MYLYIDTPHGKTLAHAAHILEGFIATTDLPYHFTLNSPERIAAFLDLNYSHVQDEQVFALLLDANDQLTTFWMLAGGCWQPEQIQLDPFVRLTQQQKPARALYVRRYPHTVPAQNYKDVLMCERLEELYQDQPTQMNYLVLGPGSESIYGNDLRMQAVTPFYATKKGELSLASPEEIRLQAVRVSAQRFQRGQALGDLGRLMDFATVLVTPVRSPKVALLLLNPAEQLRHCELIVGTPEQALDRMTNLLELTERYFTTTLAVVSALPAGEESISTMDESWRIQFNELLMLTSVKFVKHLRVRHTDVEFIGVDELPPFLFNIGSVHH